MIIAVEPRCYMKGTLICLSIQLTEDDPKNVDDDEYDFQYLPSSRRRLDFQIEFAWWHRHGHFDRQP